MDFLCNAKMLSTAQWLAERLLLLSKKLNRSASHYAFTRNLYLRRQRRVPLVRVQHHQEVLPPQDFAQVLLCHLANLAVGGDADPFLEKKLRLGLTLQI